MYQLSIELKERQLKDYKTYAVFKCTDVRKKDTWYYFTDEYHNIINVYDTLADLKKDIDNVWAEKRGL